MEDNYREIKKAEPCLKLIHMDQVEVEEIEWLFYPFIPYGKVTIIQGDPGEGMVLCQDFGQLKYKNFQFLV